MTPMERPQVSTQPLIVPGAEVFELEAHAGPSYRIYVGRPYSYDAGDRRYPVLYVLDADRHFCSALEICRERGRVDEISELLVVGIGYPDGLDYPIWLERRTFDFTAPGAQHDGVALQPIAARLAEYGRSLRTGGAPALLDFIGARLQPLVAERYRVDDRDQGIAGHSAGGNLVLHALFSQSLRLSKYIATSPALALDRQAALGAERDYAEAQSDLAATLFLAAAVDEATRMSGSAIVSSTAQMAEVLTQRAYPGLDLTCEFLPGRSHASVQTDAFQRGLEVCWPGTPYQQAAVPKEESRP